MKLLSGLVIPQLANTNFLSSDFKYWINYSLYNESNINRWNVSFDMNAGNDYNCVFQQQKMRDTG